MTLVAIIIFFAFKSKIDDSIGYTWGPATEKARKKARIMSR